MATRLEVDQHRKEEPPRRLGGLVRRGRAFGLLLAGALRAQLLLADLVDHELVGVALAVRERLSLAALEIHHAAACRARLAGALAVRGERGVHEEGGLG